VEYALRAARHDESERLFDAYMLTIGPQVERVWKLGKEAQRARFRQRYSLAGFRVIEVGGELAGVLHVEDGDGSAYVSLLLLLPAFQGRGIGSRVLEALKTEAVSRGKDLTLAVIAGSSALRLYERLGFRAVAGDEASTEMHWSNREPRYCLIPASRADEAWLEQLRRAVYLELHFATWGQWDEARHARHCSECLERGGIFCVEIDGERAGMIQLIEHADAIEVAEIQMAPPYQGRGIGSALLRDTVRRAHAGGRRVVLSTGLQNHRAFALYRRLGFRHVGKNDTHDLLEYP
jgi:ribosomal protein S18 acetylase RimI-like enzyme